MPLILLALSAQLAVTRPMPASASAADSVSLSLPEAVAQALRTGDEARAAAAQIDVTDAQVTIARAAGLPQLRVNANQSHVFESARASAVGAIFNQPNTYTTAATVSQSLFQGGRIVAGARAATQLRGAAAMDRTEILAQLSVDVQRAYVQALYARTFAAIQNTAFELAGQRLLQAQQFERAGRVSRYDVLRAGVEKANLQPALIEAESAIELAYIELRRLVNIPLNQPVILTTTLDTASVLDWVARLRLDSSIVRRSAVRSAEMIADARRQAISVAKADLLPTIGISGSIGAQAFPFSGLPSGRGRIEPVQCPEGGDPTRVCTRQNGGWFGDRSFGIAVGLPIFDGFRARGQIRLASAQARVADLQLAQTRERVASEAAAAIAELDRAQSLFATRGQNAAEAAEAFRLAQLRQSRGLATQLEVADAQLALTLSRTSEARAVYDLYLAAANYARSTGRSPQSFELPADIRTSSTVNTERAH